MTCLILAAGYATRLYPLTENFPKPLLTVAGQTITDRLIEDIASSKLVSSFIVVTNSKFAPHFEEWKKSCPYPVTIVDDGTNSNETRLGAVRDMLFALQKLSVDDDMLIVAGDNLLSFSLADFVRYAKQKNASCIMRYFESDRKRLLRSGVAVIGDNDRVLRMSEKSPNPEGNWCTPPFYYYTKEDIKRLNEALDDGCSADAPGSFAAWLCQKAPLYAMEMPGVRYDIGTLESYAEVCKIFEEAKG